MRVLALDISTNAGWAVLEGDRGPPSPALPSLTFHGNVINNKTAAEYGTYPKGFVLAAQDIATRLIHLAQLHEPDVIVIEETNLGYNRYSQKLLEFIHCLFNLHMVSDHIPIKYISSSIWRRAVGVGLTKDDKKLNAKLSKAKSAAKRAGVKLDKEALGIKGRVNKKHVAVRCVNGLWGLDFRMKDNDVAEAILLGYAYLLGAQICNGK